VKVGDGLPVPLIKNVIHDKQIKYSTNIKTFLCLEFSINVNQWSKPPPPHYALEQAPKPRSIIYWWWYLAKLCSLVWTNSARPSVRQPHSKHS